MAKKKTIKQVPKAKAYVVVTFNNTIITLSEPNGNPFLTASAGKHGFTGARKATPHAATITSEAIFKKAIEENGLQEVDVFIKGVGPGREAVLRTLKTVDLDINSIQDITPIPHNGVRPPKVRRG